MKATIKNQAKKGNQIQKVFTPIYKKFSKHHTTEGFELVDIFDIYLPFWQCKQHIIIEKELELDRFSRIILELIQNGIIEHDDICAFLGIKSDSFPIIQFHFLLKNGFLYETMNGYGLTYDGILFLDKKTKQRNTADFELQYFLQEQLNYLKNGLTQDFFDPDLPIDSRFSEEKVKAFSGYKVLERHKLNIDSKNKSIKEVKHNRKQQPNFKHIKQERAAFTTFFNQKYLGKYFYDFGEDKLEAHRRSVCFVGLHYKKKTTGENKLDIRQSPKSVRDFKEYEKEEVLTKKMNNYIGDHHNFLNY